MAAFPVALPCPKCRGVGSDLDIDYDDHDIAKDWRQRKPRVECLRCGTEGPPVDSVDRHDDYWDVKQDKMAIDAWNKWISTGGGKSLPAPPPVAPVRPRHRRR